MAWNSVGSIRGPQGPAGAQGPTGATGPTGPAAPDLTPTAVITATSYTAVAGQLVLVAPTAFQTITAPPAVPGARFGVKRTNGYNPSANTQVAAGAGNSWVSTDNPPFVRTRDETAFFRCDVAGQWLLESAGMTSGGVNGFAVVDTDSRLSNARTPTAHAASHAPGGTDPLTGYVPATAVGAASGVAALDAGGKVPQAQLPAVALVDYLGAVASQAAMLALVGQRGDWCTRTDQAMDFQLIADDPTQLVSWRAMTYPSAPVASVNGRTGAVTGLAEAADVTAALAAHTTAAVPVAPRAASAAASVSIAGDVAGDFDLTCTGDTQITPTGTPNGRTMVVYCLASGAVRTPAVVAGVKLTTGVTVRSLAIPSGGVGAFVLRYAGLGSAGWHLASSYLVT